jgi:MFS transporter, AAHS family, 4-hydroxybenzoate transporter
VPAGESLSRTIDVAEVIDGQKVGALQVRAFVLCAAVLFADGFDVQGITYVAPAISQDWSLPRGALGPTFSAGLFGVMLGALLLAPLADRIGRRRVIIASCVAFGLCTLATVLMQSLDALLVLRFFTGLGLGSALPNAIGLASEYAPKKHRASIVMFVSSGISLGAIAVGMVAARLISTVGWQAVFVVGGVLPLLLALALYRYLPESIRFAALIPSGQAEAKRLLLEIKPDLAGGGDVHVRAGDAKGGKATVVDLFRDRRGPATMLIWIAFFMSLLNVYLAINWLPTSLNASGFSLSQAAVITSMYHVGGVLGTYACGLLMDRLGPHAILIFAFLLAVVGFYTFATAPPMPQWSTTLLLMATGFGVIGGQVGITTLASMFYPVAMRSTGLGWALGVGRVGSIVGPAIGGIMLATALDARHVYVFCTVPALVGATAIALLRWRAHQPAAHAGAPTHAEMERNR